ncbi:MAG: S1 RNA-binding domain-containing protein [Oscillospiraceae bacterium]|nr:S1 RNA-binding domain-containing protein [Oscillospiraceae bacterium]
MQVEIGEILEGKVTGITKFGAFVELAEGKTGMVHISEVSNSYVEDINQFLKEGDVVKVKVINISEEGKISLSIKKTQPKPERPQGAGREGGKGGFNRERRGDQNSDRGERKGGFNKDGGKPYNNRKPRYESKPYNPSNVTSYEWNTRKSDSSNMSFEDMMSKFKQSSEDRMSDLKKSIGDVKRGSANRRANNK